jgi:hypothetical protein
MIRLLLNCLEQIDTRIYIGVSFLNIEFLVGIGVYLRYTIHLTPDIRLNAHVKMIVVPPPLSSGVMESFQ